MARAKAAKDPQQETKEPALATAPEPEAETPWYQFTDWWAGLGAQAAESKVVSLFDDARAGDPILEWLVVPGWMIASLLVARAQREHDIRTMANASIIDNFFETAPLARELLLEMIRAQGVWSPRYVEEAWAGAEAFVARSKSGQPVTTPGPSNPNSGRLDFYEEIRIKLEDLEAEKLRMIPLYGNEIARAEEAAGAKAIREVLDLLAAEVDHGHGH